MTDVLSTVIAAKEPKDLFGKADPTAASRVYRRLTKQVHPDRFQSQHRDRAEQAMANLTRLYDELAHPKIKPFVIATKRGNHEVGDLLAKGDVANVYRAVTEGKPSVVKIARSPKSADLVDREVKALKKIKDEIDPKLTAFYPRILDAFKHRDAQTKIERRGVVMDQHTVGFMTATEIRKRCALTHGVDPRDAAWMFRRLLIALGGLHKIGIVHGAVTPDHCLFQLDQHGLVLIDYTASCIEEDDKIPYLANGWEKAYPDEVGVKLTPTPATDIAMAARVLEHLMDEQAPRQMRAFIKGCTLGTQKSRPGDAWALLEEFTELIERLYGARRFRMFRFPY